MGQLRSVQPTSSEETQEQSVSPQQEQTAASSKPEKSFISIGKVPGNDIRELEINGKKTIAQLFKQLKVGISGCEILRNGEKTNANVIPEAGDTVFAVARIKGN